MNSPFENTDELNINDSQNSSRQCWICFGTEEDDRTAQWIHPCNCKGTTKWVHQGCLQQWVDEKQKSGRDVKVACPQCKTQYIIYFPNLNILVVFLDSLDALMYKSCPFMAAGIMVYWIAVIYNGNTVMQVLGQNNAVQTMESFVPTLLPIGRPCIPVFLITVKMAQWEDSLLESLRKIGPKIPLLKHVLPAPVTNETHVPTPIEEMSCIRVFTEALLLPTIATYTGDLLYKRTILSPIQRTLLGGLTFVLVRGLIKLYLKQQLYKRLSHRRILDYTPQMMTTLGQQTSP